MSHPNSFSSESTLQVGSKSYRYFDLNKAAEAMGFDLAKLPFSLKIVLENMLRFEGQSVTKQDAEALKLWLDNNTSTHEIAYRPARVLMQDFTGVPAVVDLAAMRDAMKDLGGNPDKINPLSPVDLVIDHSVMVDHFGTDGAFKKNVDVEMERNGERYSFLRWGGQAFNNFRVVPPGTGICHQVNVEYLAKTVWTKDEDGVTTAYPDTLVGTDSHTTMVNGMGVLGWGVGGIEAEAAMLGQPISMIIPEVVGFKLTGKMPEGATATDLVLMIVEMLRKHGVVGKFVEFYGEGLAHLPLADRLTIANMAPEYGATCGIFPVDVETIRYLELTAREPETIALVEAYAKAQGMWRDENYADPSYTSSVSLDMSSVVPSLAGPKRPQDRIALSDMATEFKKGFNTPATTDALDHGSVVIAAITSCTNTSNPSVMMGAGLVAKKALEKGLKVKPWVKTSLAPGSKVVTEYLERANLQDALDGLGFNLVGYGCTTCIGNSGPLPEDIESDIKSKDLAVTSVLSGNRNFEGRVHALTKGNYLASPPLVVAYAIAGNVTIDLFNEPLGQDQQGNDVYLKDIWPTSAEVQEVLASSISPDMFADKYGDVFSGDAAWQSIPTTESLTYGWEDASTYVQNPPYFEGLSSANDDSKNFNISNARVLALLGDSITTDHISPAGNIAKDSPAAEYLRENGVDAKDFNSYGSRRGNHEVMMRGTFANIRLKNDMADGKEGGWTRYVDSSATAESDITSIFDASMRYQSEGTSLVVIGGKEYGTGSSRDWAAKGTKLLGVKAVIVESFERIHRSNLVGMGVLPLQFTGSDNRESLGLKGTESFNIGGLEGANIKAGAQLPCTITYADGNTKDITLHCRLDTADEVQYYISGGILPYMVRKLAA